MKEFPLDQFEEAQKHIPQLARWTIADVIYVVETEEDIESINTKLKEVISK